MLSPVLGDTVDHLTQGLAPTPSTARVRRFIDDLLGPDEYRAAGTLRDSFAPYRATCDLVPLGADMRGSDPRVDRELFARVHQHASRETLSPLQQLFTAVTARKG